jgi:glyoxylase-like metal-dependent hydrolase (beta-lactamase superfamily II)
MNIFREGLSFSLCRVKDLLLDPLRCVNPARSMSMNPVDTNVQLMSSQVLAELEASPIIEGERPLRSRLFPVLVAIGAAAACGAFGADTHADGDAPYADMPRIAPIGARIGHYMDVPAEAKGAPVDPAKGYRLQELGKGLYMITDNATQSLFMVYETGVVVVDAPPSYAAHIVQGIREVSDRPITHLIYSHSHADHIGGATSLGKVPTIIAQEETKRLLVRDKDPNRPLPTVTFRDRYVLKVGSQVLELSYHGDGHEPGNIFIYAPAQQTLMVVDLVFPGWMPWRRLAVAHDVPGYFAQVEEISKIPFQTFVGGHVSRVGSHADVERQLEFMRDLKAAAGKSLAGTKEAEGMDAKTVSENPWAVYDDYIDRVVIKCVNELTPKWQTRLAAYDVFIWDQCYTMEQSLRID